MSKWDRLLSRLFNIFVAGTVFFLVWMLGCDSRNPASIHLERQGKPTPTRRPRPEISRARVQPGQPKPPEVRPKLKSGKIVQENLNTIEPTLKRVNLSSLKRQGKLLIGCNDTSLTSTLNVLIDRDTGSLLKTDQINPFIMTFKFQDPIKIKTIRVFPSYSTYDWALKVEGLKDRLLIRKSDPEQWSRMDLPQVVETQSVSIELLRIERDNYVHFNEIEFYQ